MSSRLDPTGYIHLLCGTYAVSHRFAESELTAIEARDPRSLVCCPECHVSTESRSYLPTYKTEPQPPSAADAPAGLH